MWSSGYLGERKRGRRDSNGQEERQLRIRMQNEKGKGPCHKQECGQIKEVICIHTEDSDVCVSRKHFPPRRHMDTVSPIKEMETQRRSIKQKRKRAVTHTSPFPYM